jgi:hypothetical protein
VEKVTRIIITGHQTSDSLPMNLILNVDHIPRMWEYISLGDGVSYYVGAVVHDYSQREWLMGPMEHRLTGPTEIIHVELRRGHATPSR